MSGLPLRKRRSALRACLTFVAAYAASLAVLFLWTAPIGSLGNQPRSVRTLGTWTAWMGAWVLRLLGIDATPWKNEIVSPSLTFVVITECTAVLPVLLFLSAVVAYPTSWRRKVVGILVGAPILLGINQVRLVSLFYIGMHFPRILEGAHLVVWQSLMIFFTVLLWLLWAARSGARDESAAT